MASIRIKDEPMLDVAFQTSPSSLDVDISDGNDISPNERFHNDTPVRFNATAFCNNVLTSTLNSSVQSKKPNAKTPQTKKTSKEKMPINPLAANIELKSIKANLVNVKKQLTAERSKRITLNKENKSLKFELATKTEALVNMAVEKNQVNKLLTEKTAILATAHRNVDDLTAQLAVCRENNEVAKKEKEVRVLALEVLELRRQMSKLLEEVVGLRDFKAKIKNLT